MHPFHAVPGRNFAQQRVLSSGALLSGCHDAASADADEGSPQPRKDRACQDVAWTVAERAAVSAHFHAERADFLMARGMEKAG
jgi:hypothetical protein